MKKKRKIGYTLTPVNGQPLRAFIGLKDAEGVFLLTSNTTKHYKFADEDGLIVELGEHILELNERIDQLNDEISRLYHNWKQARNLCRRTQLELRRYQTGQETEQDYGTEMGDAAAPDNAAAPNA